MSAVEVLRILVVEDEFLIAAELEQAIAEFGCQCVGPFATVEQATQAIQSEQIDGAILNLILQHERADDLAQLLEEKDIPFAFASAVDAADHDPRWHKKPKLTKPYRLDEIQAVLAAIAQHYKPNTEAKQRELEDFVCREARKAGASIPGCAD